MPASDYKTREEIAQLYPVSYSTLKKMSMSGRSDGPPVIRIGDRVLYHVPSFESWLDSKLIQPGEGMPKRRGRPPKGSKTTIASTR